MQNTTYNNTVIAAVQNFAKQITNAAQDSVLENNDYSVTDNADSINFIMQNYMQHTTVNSLAAAALNSNLDTVVRESIHAQLTFIN